MNVTLPSPARAGINDDMSGAGKASHSPFPSHIRNSSILLNVKYYNVDASLLDQLEAEAAHALSFATSLLLYSIPAGSGNYAQDGGKWPLSLMRIAHQIGRCQKGPVRT
jgi:hypothetical protein